MHWLTKSPDETQLLGAALARARPPAGARAHVIYLSGDLGAGKTTLARGFVRAMGIEGPVRSPSYAVLETYPLERATIVHLDAYRLQSPDEAESLGLRELDRPDSMWLVEWPERARGHLPDPDLTIRLRTRGDGHTVEVEAQSEGGHAWLGRLEPVDIATAWP